MSNKRKGYNQYSPFGRCEVCYGEIPIEYYFSQGEVVACRECDTEYIIECRHPVDLSMVVDIYDEGYFDNVEYD